jgi:hypothetical protein
MNRISWRHHYIPQFYLRGFTNNKGYFKIYDVEKKRFVKNGKWFSPQSYFFEKDSNTFIQETQKDDFQETKLYSTIDQDISDLFDRINSAKPGTDFGLTDWDMPILQYFVGILFWRIPQNYDRISYLIQQKELKELGLLLKNQNGKTIQDQKLEDRLKNDNNFFKAMKFWLPNITYLKLLECNTPLTIQHFPKGLPSLCCDNPIIMKDSVNPDVYKDDYIFPLTNNLLFIRANKVNEISTTIKIEIDLILFKQAKKYVSCTDDKYIEMLDQHYNLYCSSIDDLKQSVFKKMIE